MSNWIARIRAAVPLLLLMALAGCAARTQRTPGPGPTPVMLRRMAEAVEGHRTGAPVWVVIGSEAPHPVVGVSARREDAEALRRVAAFPVAVFGPFLAPRDPARGRQVLISCHRAGEGEDEPTVCSRPVRLDSVQSIALVVRTGTGEAQSFPVPEGVDAMFLSASGVRKYVLPYYAWVLGVDGAQRMSSNFSDGLAAAKAELDAAVRDQISLEEALRRLNTSRMPRCYHDATSAYDRRGVCPDLIIPGHHGIELVVRRANGETVTTPLPPTTEVVTFSLSAADKFVVPHFIATEGVDRAAERRRGWIDPLTTP